MDHVRAAVESGRITEPVVVVLEGQACQGVPAGVADGVTVIHAAGSGDDMLIDVASNASDLVITLVSADHEVGAAGRGPGGRRGRTWLVP